MSVFVCANSFRKEKKNKLEIVLITSFYYTTDDYTFFNIWSQLLQKIWKFLEENAEVIFAIDFQIVFCGTYFCD